MRYDRPAEGEEEAATLQVLTLDEENALGALRTAVARIRSRGGVADLAAIVHAVIEAGGAPEGPDEHGSRRLRLGSARFTVDVRPAEGGQVGVDFGRLEP